MRGGPDPTQDYYDDRAFSYERGKKQYELTNHLGNVLATISDRKFGVPLSDTSSLISYYEPDIATAQDYYPFGMMSRVALPNNNKSYAYGVNGKLNDNEVKGLGLQQDYGMRVYDNRVGRFLSVDPLTKGYPGWSPYSFTMNRPIDGVDLDGGEWKPITDWLADKAKASGQPTLSGFIRNLGGLDIQTQQQQLTNNVMNGNYRAVAKQLYGYSLKAMVDHLEETTKRAIDDNDPEAYGELYSFIFQGALGNAVMGEPPTFKFSEHPVAKTNKLAIEAHGNFEAGEGNAANTTSKGTGSRASLSKSESRKIYAENYFKEAGKSDNEVTSLMNTIDFSRTVRPKTLGVGDKVYRFERINGKGGTEMHFFTDAYGTDAGPTGVGFSEASGYKLVTYEITKETNVTESAIRYTKTKQYFSAELQNNVKKISEE